MGELIKPLAQAAGAELALADEFGEEVSEAVETLTRPVATGVTYRDYIDDVSTNALATQVKIADLEDHLSKANAPTLRPTLRPRYERAWSQLTTARARSTWSGGCRV